MELLIYSHYFAPSVGGVENVVKQLAAGLTTRVHSPNTPEFNITVITETPAKNFDDSTLPFRVVRKPGAFALAKFILRCDLLHIAGPAFLPLFLARLFRKPVVIEHHGYQSICPNGSLLLQPTGDVCPGHFQAKAYTACLRCQQTEFSFLHSARTLILTGLRARLCAGAKNIAVTRHVSERLQPTMPSEVIYHGVDDAASSNDFHTSANHQPSKVCFAYVGRLVSEKGIPILLDAAKSLNEEGLAFELLLIGDGPDRQRLQAQIATNALSSIARITGFLQGDSLKAQLDKIHAVIMPSIWEETAGLAAIEQMMRGRLVIASSIGGLAEVVGDGGMLFPPRNVTALAACMKSVIQQPELVTQFGAKARTRAVNFFTANRMLDAHARLYQRLAQENRGELEAFNSSQKS